MGKIANILANRRAKRTEIWDSWVVVTFDLLVFKVISGSFSAIVSKWNINRKWLAVEQNGEKFGTRGGGG